MGLLEGESFGECLDRFYDGGGRLSLLSDELNFVVTADKRADEYEGVQDELLRGVDRDGVLFFPFSGPPIDALIKCKNSGWGGPLITSDACGQHALTERALALRNEFLVGDKPYSTEELRQRIVALSGGVGGAYPVEDEVWENHIEARLPDSDAYATVSSLGEVTAIFNQRGASLYLGNGEQLQQIYNDLNLLSKKPGSVYVYTRGVIDKLIVDLGFIRAEGGRLKVCFTDRTDTHYPYNSILESYFNGVFGEGHMATTSDGEAAISRPDRRDSPDYILSELRKNTNWNEMCNLITCELVGKYPLDQGLVRTRWWHYKKVFRRHGVDESVNLNVGEQELLLGAVLCQNGISVGDMSILAVLESPSNITALKEAGMWEEYLGRLHSHPALTYDIEGKRFSYFRPDKDGSDSPDFLAWALYNQPEIVPEMIEFLKEKLPETLSNVRSLQTLRRYNRHFGQEHGPMFREYLLSRGRSVAAPIK